MNAPLNANPLTHSRPQAEQADATPPVDCVEPEMTEEMLRRIAGGVGVGKGASTNAALDSEKPPIVIEHGSGF
jgi:hypothetical protein